MVLRSQLFQQMLHPLLDNPLLCPAVFLPVTFYIPGLPVCHRGLPQLLPLLHRFLPGKTYVDSGDWKIILSGKKVRGGEYYLWLPGGNTLNRGTGFYEPRAYGTLTIPATARRIIAVGAYDSLVDSYADFSGRGSRMLPYLKPDLVAPGVNIVAPVPGGGYRIVTGTSFAAPFVSGAAALLMQWGIVNGNDPYLYGEKVKAYLRKGARPLRGMRSIPMKRWDGGGRYNKVTLKKVSKIKCFRSFSQHRNEALSP